MEIRIETIGNHTQEELNEYVLFLLGMSSCSMHNAFVSEDSDAEITFAEIL